MRIYNLGIFCLCFFATTYANSMDDLPNDSILDEQIIKHYSAIRELKRQKAVILERNDSLDFASKYQGIGLEMSTNFGWVTFSDMLLAQRFELNYESYLFGLSMSPLTSFLLREKSNVFPTVDLGYGFGRNSFHMAYARQNLQEINFGSLKDEWRSLDWLSLFYKRDFGRKGGWSYKVGFGIMKILIHYEMLNGHKYSSTPSYGVYPVLGLDYDWNLNFKFE